MNYDEVLQDLTDANLDDIINLFNNYIDSTDRDFYREVEPDISWGNSYIESMSEIDLIFPKVSEFLRIFSNAVNETFFDGDDYFWFDEYDRIQSGSELNEMPFTLKAIAKAIVNLDLTDYKDYL